MCVLYVALLQRNVHVCSKEHTVSYLQELLTEPYPHALTATSTVPFSLPHCSSTGLRPEVSSFFIYMLTLMLTASVSCSLAFAISAVVRLTSIGNLLVALTFVFAMVSAITASILQRFESVRLLVCFLLMVDLCPSHLSLTVCMYVCMYVRTCTMHWYICVCTRVHVRVYTYCVCGGVCTYVRTYRVCEMCVHKCECMHVCMPVCARE